MVIANILGVFILFYFLWRTLKDDYQYEKIFNLAFICLFGVLISAIISTYLQNQYWFWVSVLFVVSGFLIAIKKQRMKFYESFDGLVVAVLPWLSFVYLSDSISKSSLSSFIFFWMTLVCVFVYFFITTHYRSFTWYKSGRVGLAGILTLILFIIFRIVVAIFFPKNVLIVPNFDIYISGSSALLLILLLYNLSRNKE